MSAHPAGICPSARRTKCPLTPDEPAIAAGSGLPRAAAFQLALDLQWAQEHRSANPEGWLSPRDAGITRFILAAAVDILAGRRAPEQLRPYCDPQVFANLQTYAQKWARKP